MAHLVWSRSLLSFLPLSLPLRCSLPLPFSPPRTMHTLLFAFTPPLTDLLHPSLPRTMRCTLPPAQLSSRSVPLSLSMSLSSPLPSRPLPSLPSLPSLPPRTAINPFRRTARLVWSLLLLLPLSFLRCSPSLLRCSLPMPSFPPSLPPRTAINPFRRTARLVWSLFLLLLMSLLRCSLPLPLDLLTTLLVGATLGHSGRALPNV